MEPKAEGISSQRGRTALNRGYLALAAQGCLKSRMREIHTYGFVRGDRHSSHINKGKGVSSRLLDGL